MSKLLIDLLVSSVVLLSALEGAAEAYCLVPVLERKPGHLRFPKRRSQRVVAMMLLVWSVELTAQQEWGWGSLTSTWKFSFEEYQKKVKSGRKKAWGGMQRINRSGMWCWFIKFLRRAGELNAAESSLSQPESTIIGFHTNLVTGFVTGREWYPTPTSETQVGQKHMNHCWIKARVTDLMYSRSVLTTGQNIWWPPKKPRKTNKLTRYKTKNDKNSAYTNKEQR